MPAKNRIAAFDVAKAIAIMAVILSHTALRYSGNSTSAVTFAAFAFTFHLPVFFLINGYFLHVDRGFKLEKETNSLLRPYAVTCFLIVISVCFIEASIEKSGMTKQIFKDWLSAGIYGAGSGIPENQLVWNQVTYIGALWFLEGLFWARFFTIKIFNLNIKYIYKWLCFVVIFVVGLLSSKKLFLPFNVQTGMCASVFVAFGVIVRQRSLLEPKRLKQWFWAGLFFVWLYAFVNFNGFGIATCGYGISVHDIFRNIFGGFASSLCLIKLCLVIEESVSGLRLWQGLAYIGNNTLILFCVHAFEEDVFRWGPLVELTIDKAPFVWILIGAARLLADLLIAYLLVRLSKSLTLVTVRK